ncbi:MAG: HAD-IIIA family hydrolase [SAR324 cluster bacterium]|nr:HAD-IIIA family hydrolase [SAR324 cluster bacterium]
MRTVFVDRDGVINQEPGPILTPEQFIWIPRSAEAIKKINEQSWRCIVVSNQSGFARGTLSMEQFQAICDKMNQGFAKVGAHIDDLFYCPHYPKPLKDGVKELCVDCECRKPGTMMFDQAARKHGILPKDCVFIGDTTTDFEAAYRWGMPVIGVRTGHAGDDRKCDREPFAWVDDLYEAVTMIIRKWPGPDEGVRS